jgi:hypothetical protein
MLCVSCILSNRSRAGSVLHNVKYVYIVKNIKIKIEKYLEPLIALDVFDGVLVMY